jgi:hypothetical protein
MKFILVAMFINSAGVPVFFEPRPFETMAECENSPAPAFTKKYRDSEYTSAFLCITEEDFNRVGFDKATNGVTH